MSDTTNIAWCDSTWNPLVGCEKVSDGCKHCYADALAQRFGRDFSKRSVSEAATFNAPLKWRKKPWVCENDHPTTGLGDAPLDGPHCDLCGGEVHRRRVFLGSMMDWLDTKISIVAKMLDIVRRCPELDFLCVTKRPELWRERLNNVVNNVVDLIDMGLSVDLDSAPYTHWEVLRDWLWGWLAEGETPSNVWIIASVENQAMAEKRIPELLKIPAVVRGLSIEPMIEPIDLTRDIPKVDWVIVGGEYGKNARQCNVEWVRNIVRQCKSAGVPCFVKQLGTVCITDNANMDDWPKYTRIIDQGIGCAAGRVMTVHSKGGEPVEWPEDLRVRQFPKAKK